MRLVEPSNYKELARCQAIIKSPKSKKFGKNCGELIPCKIHNRKRNGVKKY